MVTMALAKYMETRTTKEVVTVNTDRHPVTTLILAVAEAVHAQL